MGGLLKKLDREIEIIFIEAILLVLLIDSSLPSPLWTWLTVSVGFILLLNVFIAIGKAGTSGDEP